MTIDEFEQRFEAWKTQERPVILSPVAENDIQDIFLYGSESVR